eukprot:scaffold316489_cov23-Tisochrysis_lutea.AAC.1
MRLGRVWWTWRLRQQRGCRRACCTWPTGINTNVGEECRDGARMDGQGAGAATGGDLSASAGGTQSWGVQAGR